MRDIEREIELETKDIVALKDEVVAKVKENIHTASTDELKSAIEMVGELADAKLDCIKGKYYETLITAMEKNADDYGETWDENGEIKGFTRSRDSRGRYMRGYDDAMRDMRDMDRDSKHVMYYPNGNDMGNSRYETAKRGYEEVKDIKSLNALFDALEDDVRMLKPKMSATDQATARQRMTTLTNMF